MAAVSSVCKNIIYDRWLSDILSEETYKVELDDSFIKGRGRKIIKEMESKGVFLYSKVPADHIAKIKFLEGLGFNLIDTNVVFTKPVSPDYEAPADTLIRFAAKDDEADVVELAGKGFTFSRFHLDKDIPKAKANEIKAEWVRSYFSGKRGKHMVIAVAGNSIKGFLQLLQDDKGTLVIDLIAVNKDSRNKGIASNMIKYTQANCRGAKQIKVGTQIANIPSIRMYEKLGFRLAEAYYVFHYHSFKRTKK